MRVLGQPIPEEQASAKRDVGFVSEDMRLHGNVTLAWYMKFVASIYPGWDAAYADVHLNQVALGSAGVSEFSFMAPESQPSVLAGVTGIFGGLAIRRLARKG